MSVVLEVLVLAPKRGLFDDLQMELVVRNVEADSEVGELIVLEYQTEVFVLRQPPDWVQLCQQVFLLLLVLFVCLSAPVDLVQLLRLLDLQGFLLLELCQLPLQVALLSLQLLEFLHFLAALLLDRALRIELRDK